MPLPGTHPENSPDGRGSGRPAVPTGRPGRGRGVPSLVVDCSGGPEFAFWPAEKARKTPVPAVPRTATAPAAATQERR
ncbi:hypothetical protein DP939_38995 [Spongiactinospora rosea]|uniref:Uncharacterized protein n=1 Tax=Spongiactinospora rosea TaxID=2248750 RepID=A0A366LMN1_9ACTN|nr:hypothetical protein DP939_38995 [Spongiactinospora rosea]